MRRLDGDFNKMIAKIEVIFLMDTPLVMLMPKEYFMLSIRSQNLKLPLMKMENKWLKNKWTRIL
jgi:hypothetical protein